MSDPKHKWNQPAAPPAPMFFGKKERDLVKQVNDELSERIIGQPIAYYAISAEESNFNETYGEAVEKVSLPPIRVYAYVVVENEQTNEKFGYEYQTKLTVNFHRRRLVEDQNLYVRVGDFVQYGDEFYEIVRLYNDTRFLFGQVEHKFQVTADCIRARQGVFKVMPGLEREKEFEVASGDETPRTAPFPPIAASYITVNSEAKLPNERVLKAGTGISLNDTGPNGTLTVSATGLGAATPVTSVQFNAGDGAFGGSNNLTFNGATLTGSYTGSLAELTTLSASAANLLLTSGTMAGPGSYLSLDTNNNVVLATGDGASSTPGGANTQIQFNNAGAFGASSTFTFDGTAVKADTGLVHSRTAVVTEYTASAGDYILSITGVPTEILFDATLFAEGQVLVVKDESGAASASNTILLSASGVQTIDGERSVEIESPYGSVLIYSNGTNWFIY